tara:strand:+ start:2046 stop:2249 length:204 start_codon:yes stop_codon:yes gene_type:complete
MNLGKKHRSGIIKFGNQIQQLITKNKKCTHSNGFAKKIKNYYYFLHNKNLLEAMKSNLTSEKLKVTN